MSISLYRPTPLSVMLDRLYNAELARTYAPQARTLPVDVIATENDYVIQAVAPGLKAEDLSVEIEDNTVTIKGETKLPEVEKGRYLLDEVCYGKFERSLRIDAELDGSKAEARLENGLFTLRIPKAESAKPKVVKVMAR